jgi:CubicO group peptidase (beta-lactamase class C family)
MHTSLKLKALLSLCILCLFSTARADSKPGLDTDTQKQIEKIVRQELKSTGTPSASIAIVIDDKIVYTEAFGQAALVPNRLARPEMRYAIASVSKEFLGAAMVMLEEEGRLSLDDKVTKYIPEAGPAGAATIRQLLSHTAGIRDYWPQDYVFADMLKPITHDAILNRWARQPLDFEPGSKWQYSNTGYVMAGVIFEKVAKESLFDYLQRKVFTPLKMASVIDADAGPMGGDDAVGYTSKGLGPMEAAPILGPGWLFAAGELAMTAEDLAKWDISLMDQSLLSKTGYKSLERDTLLNNGAGTRYALGIGVTVKNERRILSHGGEASGYLTSNVIYPDNHFAVVVITNTDSTRSEDTISAKLQELILSKVSQESEMKKASAQHMFNQFAHNKIDRALFSENFNAYFTDAALKATAQNLSKCGPVKKFTQKSASTRGGMDTRVYEVETAKKTFIVVTRTLNNNLVEQYTFAPQ